jgi:phage terminase large subunit-like protein
MTTTATAAHDLAARLRAYARDPAAFRADLRIDTGAGEPVRFGDVAETWQRADFTALDHAWRRLAGHRVDAPVTRAYLERGRGHSKTSDLAVMVTWALAFSPRRLTGVAGAADLDQSRLLRDAIDRLIDANPWLRQLLDVQRYAVENPRTKSRLEILSADAASSYGHLVDFVVCDELCHWPRPDLWYSLFSASAKTAGCVLCIISNAGTGAGTSWQWHVREGARTGPGWHFHSLDGPQASWISPQTLAEQRRMLPAVAFARLWLNRWSTGAGDTLDPSDIDAALSHGIDQLEAPEAGYAYAAGLDLGLRHDAAAFVIVGRHVATGRYRLARVWGWRPSAVRAVDLADVETAIIDAHRAFRFGVGFADPWQGDYLVSRLRAAGVPFELHPFSEPNLDAMARHFVNQFTERNVWLFDHPFLTAELGQTGILEKTSGKLRLEWPRSEHGHGDHATAFALALAAAKMTLGTVPGRQDIVAAALRRVGIFRGRGVTLPSRRPAFWSA